MTDTTTAPEANAQETQDQGPGLSLNDIAAAVQIIDVATGRGAIRGDELSSVGTVRDRFMAFLNHAKEQGQIDRVPGDPLDEEATGEEAA